jgi:hypothetical protein
MADQDEVTHHKTKVEKMLQDLKVVFAKVSVGDLSANLQLPEGEDEFTELYAGVQLILEILREKIEELTQRTQELEKMNNILVSRELRMVELKQTLKQQAESESPTK